MKKRVLKTSIISMLCVALVSVFVGVGLAVKPDKAKADGVVMSSEVEAIFNAFKNVEHDANVSYEVTYAEGKGIHVKVINWTSNAKYLNPLRFAVNYNIDATKLSYYDKLISISDTREALSDGSAYDSVSRISVALNGGSRKNCLDMNEGSFKLYDDTWENGSGANAIYGGASSGAGASTEFTSLGNIFTPGQDGVALYYDYNLNGLYVSNASGENYNVVKLFDVDRANYGNYTNPMTGEALDSNKGANKNGGQSAKYGSLSLIIGVFDCGITNSKRPLYEFDIDAFGGIDLTDPLSTFESSHQKAEEKFIMSADVKGILDAFKNVEHDANVSYEVTYAEGKGIHVKVTNWSSGGKYLNPLRFAVNYNIDATKLSYYDKLISISDTREALSDGSAYDSVSRISVALNGGSRKNCLDMNEGSFKLYDDTWENGSGANAIYGGASSGAGASTEFTSLGNIFTPGQDGVALYYDYNLNGLYVSNASRENYNVVKLFDVDRANYGNYTNPMTGEALDSNKGANKNGGQSAKYGSLSLIIGVFDCGITNSKRPLYEFDIDSFAGVDLTNPLSTFESTHEEVEEKYVMSSTVKGILNAFTNADHASDAGYEVSYNKGKGIHIKITNWTYSPYKNPLRIAINYDIDATKLSYYNKLISFTDTKETLHDNTTYDTLTKMQVSFASGTRKNCLEMTNDYFKLYDDTWENGSASNAIYGGASSGAGSSTEFTSLGEVVSAGSNKVSLYYDYDVNGLYVSNANFANYNVVKLFDVDRANYKYYANPVTGEAFDSNKGANKNGAQSAKLGTVQLTLSFFDCGAQGSKKPLYEFDIDSFAGIDLTDPFATFESSNEQAYKDFLALYYDGTANATLNEKPEVIMNTVSGEKKSGVAANFSVNKAFKEKLIEDGGHIYGVIVNPDAISNYTNIYDAYTALNASGNALRVEITNYYKEDGDDLYFYVRLTDIKDAHFNDDYIFGAYWEFAGYHDVFASEDGSIMLVNIADVTSEAFVENIKEVATEGYTEYDFNGAKYYAKGLSQKEIETYVYFNAKSIFCKYMIEGTGAGYTELLHKDGTYGYKDITEAEAIKVLTVLFGESTDVNLTKYNILLSENYEEVSTSGFD